ncbi:hypothetical protein Tco_0356665, partial [Tanacetum coccineum]
QVSDKLKIGLGYNAATSAVDSFMNSSEMLKNQENAKPKAVHNGVVKGNKFNTVKASACWVWMPKNRVIDHINVADETSVDVRYGGDTTTVTGLKAGQGSDNIDKTPTMPHDLPLLRVNTLGSDEGIMQHKELMGRHEHEPKFDYDLNAANVPVTTVGAKVSTTSPEVKTAGDSINDIAAET